MIKSAVVDRSTHDERRAAHQRLAKVFAEQPERRGHHLAEAALASDEDIAIAVEDGAHLTLQRGDVVGAITRLMRAADLSPHPRDRSRRLADAAYIGAHSAGQLENSSRLLRDAHRRDPTLGETLHAAVATAYLLLNSDGNAETTHNLLTVAIESALSEPDQDRDGLSEALYTLVLRVPLFRAVGLLGAVPRGHLATVRSRHRPRCCCLPRRSPTRSQRRPGHCPNWTPVIEQLRDSTEVDLIIRTAIAGFYTDRLPGCRDALSRVVRDGREGGAVGSAMMALLMIAFDELNAGRWDAAEGAAIEATALCEERGIPAVRVERPLRPGPRRRRIGGIARPATTSAKP